MRLLIGLDHELLRNGLVHLLKDVRQVEYMVLATSTEMFIESVQKYEFDLIVVDADLRGAGGLRSLISILEILPHTTKKVFMYNSLHPELEELLMNKDIQGLFYEQSPLGDLMSFFEKVLNGEQAFLNNGSPRNYREIDEEFHELSKREEEVFYMKLRGYTVKDTAQILNISPKTVENHRRNIRKKLNIHKGSEWYDWGKKLGVI
ncbi:response regulator transcription factor [Evansella cellulosilytica]|uniref:Two component transcriptional regulator, LuxR family n=1 Tax=Evansella cellulosilytica (strain ATCC 21833 / DSM 2522 / FERM P-1141 / JCM 9156 / N-4) TaxID=649639 RepID=E6TU77_EVAC2|nr:response regulator transcription factor [Evansella cellulosilytica]ADU28537.1 two component transcriptional regulator, LuxR family [Evansella cellulosilytica DSM 2522]